MHRTPAPPRLANAARGALDWFGPSILHGRATAFLPHRMKLMLTDAKSVTKSALQNVPAQDPGREQGPVRAGNFRHFFHAA